MFIEHECACGAIIRLPDTAAGRRARCRSCGLIFRVPESHHPDAYALAEIESSPHAKADTSRIPDVGVGPNGTIMAYRAGFDAPGQTRRGSDDQALARSFWEDLAWSFGFLRRSSNVAPYAIIVGIHWGLLALGSLPFVCLLAWGAWPFFLLWLGAFYLNVVVETAQGDDEVSASNLADPIDDIFVPGLRFFLCCIVGLAPTTLALALATSTETAIPWHVLLPTAIVGLLLWPLLIVGTAIGEQLPIRSLPALLKGMASTPGPYLAVCVMVVVAGLIAYGMAAGFDGLLLRAFDQKVPPMLQVVSTGIGAVAGVYGWIVAMRMIGVYYRHHKEHFPWRT